MVQHSEGVDLKTKLALAQKTMVDRNSTSKPRRKAKQSEEARLLRLDKERVQEELRMFAKWRTTTLVDLNSLMDVLYTCVEHSKACHRAQFCIADIFDSIMEGPDAVVHDQEEPTDDEDDTKRPRKRCRHVLPDQDRARSHKSQPGPVALREMDFQEFGGWNGDAVVHQWRGDHDSRCLIPFGIFLQHLQEDEDLETLPEFVVSVLTVVCFHRFPAVFPRPGVLKVKLVKPFSVKQCKQVEMHGDVFESYPSTSATLTVQTAHGKLHHTVDLSPSAWMLLQVFSGSVALKRTV